VANYESNDISVFSIDASGALTLAAAVPVADGWHPVCITLNPAGTVAYVANRDTANISAFAIAANGTLAELGGSPFVTGQGPFAVTVDPAGTFVYTPNQGSDSVSGFTIDASTGALTLLGNVPAGKEPVAFAITRGGL